MTDTNMCSDCNLKERVVAVDPEHVPGKLASLDVAEWGYAWDGPDVCHIGPMVQDFHAAFGVGNNDATIFPLDGMGVVFAAIKALRRIVEAQQAQIDELTARLG